MKKVAIFTLFIICIQVIIGSDSKLAIDLPNLNISQIHQKILSGNATCTEITGFFLDRIKRYNHVIHAVITITPETGLFLEAARLDQYYKTHNNSLIGPLHCVPTLIKDNIMVKDLPMTLGVNAFANYTPDQDAVAVQKLRRAGAVILGKANMTPFACEDPRLPSPAGGLVRNPYALNYTASSSSNGNAVALAARFSVIGLGSDSAGSITSPASASNIYGFRPAVGSFNMSGVFPLFGNQSDVIGIMTFNSQDLCTVLQVLTLSESDNASMPCIKQLIEPVPKIRIGIIGRLTYGGNISALRNVSFKVNYEVQLIMRHLETNLRQFENIINLTIWRETEEFRQLIASQYRAMLRYGSITCVAKQMAEFWNHHEMRAQPGGVRIRHLSELLNTKNGSQSYDIGPTDYLRSYEQRQIFCPKQSFEIFENVTKEARSKLDSTVFHNFDIIVFPVSTDLTYPIDLDQDLDDKKNFSILTDTLKHPLIDATAGFFGKSVSGSFETFDMAALFGYPGLSVPAGFSEPKPTSGAMQGLPLGAFFMCPTKLALMLEVVKLYEDKYTIPVMPAKFP